MNIYDYTTLSPDEALLHIRTDKNTGLSSQERKNRLFSYGANEITGKETDALQIFLRQFRSPFTYLLFAAAAITLLLGDYLESALVLVFVAINTALGFYQEFKSEKTLSLLREYFVSTETVLEGGEKKRVPISELVPGDIIFLEPGDIVPADVRFLEEHDLVADEAVLTGETIPIKKRAEAMRGKAKESFEAVNLGFSGTTIVCGNATALVLATGMQTVFGSIAKLAGETERASLLEKEISKFSSFILKLVVGTLAIVFLVNIFIKGDEADIFTLAVFSIALAVSVIPEALPVVITFSLSRGAKRLAKNKAVVKRLSAIEDVGSIEILCTDKTGTLTENKLAVSAFFPEKDRNKIMRYATLGSPAIVDKEELVRNSFDAALWNKLSKEEKGVLSESEMLLEAPFDPVRRVNSAIVRNSRGSYSIARGAPESVFEYCSPISRDTKREITEWMKKEGEEGKRVYAVAMKEISKKEIEKKDWKNSDDAALIKDLEFVGLVSFIDPLKPTTRRAVAQAKRLGVRVKILTGDNPAVAGAVAHTIGLAASPSEVITGSFFEKASEKEKMRLVESYNVFARVSPKQKYDIIQTLQKTKNVGFLGEGINDAGALKIANVALVVSGASDIARESADIVLLQKSLHVIVDAIEEGRRVFANTTKYIQATLSSNFGNFYAVAVSSFLVPYLPMLPLQLLLLNLLSDFPMIAISTDSVDKEELRSPKKYNIRQIAGFATVLGIVSTVFDFIFFALFYLDAPAVLQTSWFIGSVVTELLFLLSVRTHKFFLHAPPLPPMIAILSLLAFIVAVWIPFTEMGSTFFGFTPPSMKNLMLIGIVALTYLAATETAKLLYYRHMNNHGA
ncbi:HAD-IC family P-type ATPase [bacterium]|nr:HAD-IC family P-type ATPase [bacterium]